ncbi:NAD(P)/FAD-dependent oxidoreductase [Rubrivivax gelatinosus]|uniref:L-2-hydroxyglutarate oxidase LhgO n=1 Tax=Rubrivivax gelatinosus TaxID=28068 RepID=A0A4R2M2X4_RUBGE|nr:NAD(P)/FAD-dependent oxidoreductase [Rubrivivax gelatinosus]MBK1686829.1 FAD-dependent oxidoreductase [Rubrivivax gelatinosus]TCP01469.1 L-2-hydroxyglutarate oxidase LhgO [Rubrivivax gelatinosus]
MDRVEVVVVGAGVVGLAVARALACAGLEVLILEREGAIGSGVSSRNSEVVHAGLYYPAGSLKARLCMQGRERLYAYCAERGVDARRCGKLVVATTEADLHKLDTIAARGHAAGVEDLQRLSAAEAMAMEPALACAGALWSPSSGIVDSHGLMTALLGDAENAGALLALRSPFATARRDGEGWIVATGGDEAFELATRWIVNAAALDAQQVAAAMQGFPATAVPPTWRAKGHYFSLAGRAPFSRLVYPTPVDGGLGVHLTLDLGGQARFGPDVEWLAPGAPLDYAVDPARQAGFEDDIRRYWPGLPAGALQPAYSGIRPKISGPGEPAADFVVAGPAEHGVPGVVQLFGIESPGLTACLALADEVAGRIVPSATSK